MNKDLILSKLQIMDSEYYYVGNMFFLPNGNFKHTEEEAREIIQSKQLESLKDILNLTKYDLIGNRIEKWINYNTIDKILNDEMLDFGTHEFIPEYDIFVGFIKKYKKCELFVRITKEKNQLIDIVITGIRCLGPIDFSLIKEFLDFRFADEFVIEKKILEAQYI